jgi:hypothetical protein
MGETLTTCNRVRQPPSSWIWRVIPMSSPKTAVGRPCR